MSVARLFLLILAIYVPTALLLLVDVRLYAAVSFAIIVLGLAFVAGLRLAPQARRPAEAGRRSPRGPVASSDPT